jgi:uncharacterized protein involved in outer membrane biogenesis
MKSGLRLMLRWTAYLVAGLVLLLIVMAITAQFWLKGWLESTVSDRTGRELRIGSLSIDWSPKPLLVARDVHFANADWAKRDDMAAVGELAVRVAALPLLHGKLVLPELRIRDASLLLQRGSDRQANWILDAQHSDNNKHNASPQIERLTIENTMVRYTETERQTDVKIEVKADPGAADGEVLTAKGDGVYRGQTFTLKFSGDSLLHLLTPEDLYDMRLHIAAADTEATLEGQVLDPRVLKASDLDLQLKLSGPDPARLYKLVGLPLPSLPPYSISGKLVRNGQRWILSQFDGRVGDSDLHGSIGLAFSGERPMLTADLRSESLDFDDLGGLVGATPGTGPGETASKQQRREKQHKPEGRALPDKQIDLRRLRSIDARVQFQGEHVRAGKLPIDEVNIDFTLRDGRMHFQPLAFRAGSGTVKTEISIDASGEAPNAKLDGEFVHLDLARLLADVDFANDSVGQVGGRAKLWMRGNSVAALLANADGGIYLIMTGGRLDRILVELAGLDIGETVMAKLGEGQQSIPIECGYADIQMRDGLLDLDKVVIDTNDTLFTADGRVNLATEQLDVELNPHPKDVSMFAARSKLHIGGTLGNPQVLPGAATLVKGAAAAALAAVAGPAAALVPLMETGSGKDSAACASFTRSVDAGAVDAQPKEKEESK